MQNALREAIDLNTSNAWLRSESSSVEYLARVKRNHSRRSSRVHTNTTTWAETLPKLIGKI